MAASILRPFAVHLHHAVRLQTNVTTRCTQRWLRCQQLSTGVRILAEDVASSSDLHTDGEQEPVPRANLYRELCSVGTIEGVFEKIGEREFNGNEASVAVSALRQIHRRDSMAMKSELLADERFKNLSSSIATGVKHLSNESLTSTLANALHLNSEDDDFIFALEGECRRRLRLLPIRSIAMIVCNDQLMSGRPETKALVQEAARVLELRWREVESPQLVRRLLPAAARVSKPLLERIEDKVLEMLSKFSFQDITALTKALANTSTRSLPILRAISYQLQEQRTQWETPAIIAIMSSMSNLGFHNTALFSEFATHIQQNIDDCPVGVLCDIAKTYAVLRVQANDLLESIHRVAVGSVDALSILDLKRLLFAYSQFIYTPPSASEFYDEIINSLSGRSEEILQRDMIDLVHSLAVLQQVPPQALEKLLQPSDADQRLSDLKETQKLKLQQINSYAQLELSSYQGPFLSAEQKTFPPNRQLFKTSLNKSLINVLKPSLGEDFSVEEQVRTELGYVIDAEISSKVEGNGQRLAVVTLGPPCYLHSSRQLIGRLEMMLRHLRLSGYQVLEIPFLDWYPLRTSQQQIAYLKDKLAQLLN